MEADGSDDGCYGSVFANVSERERHEALLEQGIATLGLRPPRETSSAETKRFLSALIEGGSG